MLGDCDWGPLAISLLFGECGGGSGSGWLTCSGLNSEFVAAEFLLGIGGLGVRGDTFLGGNGGGISKLSALVAVLGT